MTLQFKIQIRGISKPPVWRRIVIPGEFTFHDFHLTIQKAFGWWNEHLYQFQKTPHSMDWTVGIPDEESGFWFDMPDDARQINVASFILSMGLQKFVYVYDFGDNWVHDITLEQTDKEATIPHPVCLAGKSACPPEDCGGAWGYEDLKEEMSEYEIKEFSLQHANECLRHIVPHSDKQAHEAPKGQAPGSGFSKTLSDILADFSEEDLLDNAEMLSLKMNQNATNQDTWQLYAQALIDNVEAVLCQLPSEDLFILESLLEKPTPDCSVIYYDNFYDPTITTLGLAEMCENDAGDTYALIASDFWEAAKPHVGKVREKEEVQFRIAAESFISGLTNLYGQVSLDFVIQEAIRQGMASTQDEAEGVIQTAVMKSLLLKSLLFFKAPEQNPSPGNLLFLSAYGWDNPLQLERTIAAKGKTAAAPRLFSLADIFAASLTPIPIISNPLYDTFFNMLTDDLEFSDDEATDICHQLWYREMHQADDDHEVESPQDFFEEYALYEYDAEEEMYQKAMDLLAEYLDNMPHWQLKGQSLAVTETDTTWDKDNSISNARASNLITMPVIVKKAPGRNDPCPCGSGKKYKKCCGREN